MKILEPKYEIDYKDNYYIPLYQKLALSLTTLIYIVKNKNFLHKKKRRVHHAFPSYFNMAHIKFTIYSFYLSIRVYH